VFVLHGGGGSGAGMELLTRGTFNRIADRDGAIVVYPDGVDRHWNDGRDLPETAARERVDDVGLMLALVAGLASEHALDRGRIFATGISNGGFMSMRLACDAATTFAAVAPVTATLSERLGSRCNPARSIAVAIVNGTEDPLVPWSGGTVRMLGASRGDVWSAQKTFERWLELDACRARATDARVDRIPDDETALIVHHGSDCRDRVEVRLYEIQGGGHTWPMGASYAREWLVGRVSRELDATQEIWKFMQANARSAGP
jgi:polyhydroxybutyrate depolymerase